MLLIETQKDLKRLGCLTGDVTGVSDEPTRAALARYASVTGRGDEATPVTSELLEDLRSETGAICRRRPIVASVPLVADPASGAASPRAERPEVKRIAPPRTLRPLPKVAHAAVAPRAVPTPHGRISREPYLMRLPIRQAELRPGVRQAERGGTAAAVSSASSTVSGLNGI